jgi:hypothetical protein
VTSEDLHPAEIASPHLPVPTLTPAPVTATDLAPEPNGVRSGLTHDTKVAEAGGEPAVSGPRLLNPQERARADKARLTADAAAKAKAAKQTLEASTTQAKEANKAIAALRDAELALAAARQKLEAAANAAEAAKTPEAVERAKAARASAESNLAEATKAAADATARETTATAAAFAAARAAWDAERESQMAAAAAKAAEKITDPISIFISKKTGRLYIRQGWTPIHEAAVNFKDPDGPLGTHLFLALAAHEEGKSLRWMSVSMPPAHHEERRQRGARGRGAEAPPMSSPRLHDTPQSALERVEIPEETRSFIADRVWIGASLIISDQGISSETGAYTDFVVLTR